MSDNVVMESVDALDCRVVAHDWAFARDREKEIAAHWRERLASGQKLWNGRVLLALDAQVVLRDGRRVFQSRHFETDFAAFLAFRDWGFPDPRVRNCFAMAALRGADGPFLLARMGAHTANRGQIYFAAGTPDRDDVTGDTLDLAGSILRELTEETGLTSADVVVAPGYTIACEGGRIACLQEVRTHASANDVIARVASFLAAEKTPEIDGLVAIRSEADFAVGPMPPFLPVYLRARLQEAADQLPLG